MSTDPGVVAANDTIWVFPEMSHRLKCGKYGPHGLVKSGRHGGSNDDEMGGDTRNGPDQYPLRRTLAEPQGLTLGQESWYSIEFEDYRNQYQQGMEQRRPYRGAASQSSPANHTRDNDPLEESHHDSDLLSYIHTEELIEDNELHFVLSDSAASEFYKPRSPLVIPEPISITDIYRGLRKSPSNKETKKFKRSIFQRYKVHIMLGLSVTAVAVISFKWIFLPSFSSDNHRTTSLRMTNSSWTQSTHSLAKLQSSLRVFSQRLMLYCSTLLNSSAESRKDLRLSLYSAKESVACVLQDVLKLSNLFITF